VVTGRAPGSKACTWLRPWARRPRRTAGRQGVLRRDPFAMLRSAATTWRSLCHWITLGHALQDAGATLPKIFTVTGSHRMPRASSYGRLWREHARCCSGSSTASGARGRRRARFCVTPRYETQVEPALEFTATVRADHGGRAGDLRKELASHSELFSKLHPHLPAELEQTRASSSGDSPPRPGRASPHDGARGARCLSSPPNASPGRATYSLVRPLSTATFKEPAWA